MSRQEDDVRARKLQPIYNAIDSRNYKMALKLCAKKDLEKWDMVKALKAHALERTGRADEALDLCREVKARNPTDETLLTTICLTFKVMRESSTKIKAHMLSVGYKGMVLPYFFSRLLAKRRKRRRFMRTH